LAKVSAKLDHLLCTIQIYFFSDFLFDSLFGTDRKTKGRIVTVSIVLHKVMLPFPTMALGITPAAFVRQKVNSVQY